MRETHERAKERALAWRAGVGSWPDDEVTGVGTKGFALQLLDAIDGRDTIIDALEGEVERLRAALRKIRDGGFVSSPTAMAIARSALAGTEASNG